MQILLAYILGGPHGIQTKTGQIYNFLQPKKSLFGAFVAVEFCIIQVERNII